MSRYVIDLPEDDEIRFFNAGYVARVGNSILINADINELSKLTVDEAIQVDKRFEDAYIRRWRVLAMLRNIRNKIVSGEDVIAMISNYLRFIEKLDEKKWEKEFCAEM